MRAVTYTKYGGPEVLNLNEVNKPVPKKNEVLIQIYATAVNSGDLRLRKADPFAVRFIFGLFKPRKQILGAVFAGLVEEAGNKVKKFKTGDKVFGMTGMSMGGYAEYKCMSEGGCISLMPVNINYEEAASVPFGATTAMHFLKKAEIKKGQKVLIYGASGSVGTAAIQLAKYFQAEVTGVCSTVNVSLVKSLGADRVIDYTKDDFTENGEKYDVIYETVNKISFSKCLRSLNKKGTLILGAAGITGALKGLWYNMTSAGKFISGVNSENVEDLKLISVLIEKGEFKHVIDRQFNLEEIAEAHRYVEKGHKSGSVVIKLRN